MLAAFSGKPETVGDFMEKTRIFGVGADMIRPGEQRESQVILPRGLRADDIRPYGVLRRLSGKAYDVRSGQLSLYAFCPIKDLTLCT